MRGLGCRFGRLLGFAVGRRRVGFGDCGFADLETADPDLVVGQGETHDVVDERLGFARSFGYAECVCKKLLDQEEVRGGGEVGGE